MAIRRRDPLADLVSFQEALDRLFDVRHLPIDAWETDREIVVRTHVAGARPEDVEMKFSEGTLSIKARIPSEAEKEVEGRHWLYHEVGHGEFTRTIMVSPSLDAGKAEASYENGVLTITIPKKEAARPREIKIKPKERG